MSHDLTPQQYQAIDLLVEGKTLSDIATTLHIDRRTLWRWRHLPGFQEAYRERQEWLRAELVEEMAKLTHMAFAVVENQLRNPQEWDREGRKIASAFTYLKLLQPARIMVPTPSPRIAEETSP